MSIPAQLLDAIGDWVGHNKLWFEPGSVAFECETTATLSSEAAGRMLALRYTWSQEGRPCEGILLLGDDIKAGRCDAAWADSFHNGHRLMPMGGSVASDGAADLRGSYPAPPGPDWGWRITLAHPAPDALVMRMYNITPDGTEALAVEASYARRR